MTARSNRYRDLPTPAILAALECGRWDLADLDANPSEWDYPAESRAFLDATVADAEAELARRQRLRHHRLAPAWPDARVELEDIRDRIELAAYVERTTGIPLRRMGRQLRAFCPFPDHPAHSPGFVVHPEKQLWHCFGCLRGGDVFAFCMELHDCDFPTAVTLLTQEAGLEPKASGRRGKHRRPARRGSVRIA